MAKELSYVKKVEALIKGDDAKEVGVKNQKKLQTGIASQLAMKAAVRLDLEQSVEDAEEKLEAVLLNQGKLITRVPELIQNYLDARSQVNEANEALQFHDTEVEWLKEALRVVTED